MAGKHSPPADSLRAEPAAPLAEPVVRPKPAAPVVAAASFEIIHTHIVLRHDPDKYPLYGDVARLTDGRLRARFSFPGVDATTLTGYRDWAKDEDIRRTSTHVVDWAYQFRAKLRNAPDVQTLLPTDREYEFARLSAAYPTIARIPAVVEEFAGAAIKTAQLFDCGSTSFVNPREFGWGQEWWRRYTVRHASGDFGMFGGFTAKMWSPDELWCRDEIIDQSMKNSVAIAIGTGGIISRFVLDDYDQERFPKPVRFSGTPPIYGDRPVRFVEVSSAPFLRSGAQTICTIGEVNPYAKDNP